MANVQKSHPGLFIRNSGVSLAGFFLFLDPNSKGFFHLTQANLHLTQENFASNSQFWQIDAEFSTSSTEFSQISV